MDGLQMSRHEHGLGLKRGTVALKAHQAEWEREAARTIKRLTAIFGPAAADIQHALGPGPSHNAFGQHRLAHFRKQGQQINLHHPAVL